MTKKALYEKLVLAAYIFYILLAAMWLLIEVYVNKSITPFDYVLLGAIGIFSLQLYYKRRVANLAIGLILLAVSIFSVPYFLSWGGKQGFDTFIYTALSLCLTSIVFSIILVFSYLKLSFGDD